MMDLSECMIQIDYYFNTVCRPKYLTKSIEHTRLQFQHIRCSVMRKRYKEWVEEGRPIPYIYHDHRHTNMRRRTLTETGETEIVDQILEMNQSQRQVTIQTIREQALKQWTVENNSVTKEYSFNACDGWIYNFVGKHGLFSQLVSKHSKHFDVNDDQHNQLIDDYLKHYIDLFHINGPEHVYNFDETSFSDNSGCRTIAKKRTHTLLNQPSIKNYLGSNQMVNIGCTITASGQRLKPIINVKCLSNRCLNKYRNGLKIIDHILSCTSTSWFREETLYHVLYQIHQHSKGADSLCIWDGYKPHLQPSKIERANCLNIKILQVQPNMTYKYQPLDVKFNGVLKTLMKSYWLSYRFNEQRESVCQTWLKQSDTHTIRSKKKPSNNHSNVFCINSIEINIDSYIRMFLCLICKNYNIYKIKIFLQNNIFKI